MGGCVAAAVGAEGLGRARAVSRGVRSRRRSVGCRWRPGGAAAGGGGTRVGFNALAAKDLTMVAGVGGEAFGVGLVGGFVWCLVGLVVWLGVAVWLLLVFGSVRGLSSLCSHFPPNAWE